MANPSTPLGSLRLFQCIKNKEINGQSNCKVIEKYPKTESPRNMRGRDKSRPDKHMGLNRILKTPRNWAIQVSSERKFYKLDSTTKKAMPCFLVKYISPSRTSDVESSAEIDSYGRSLSLNYPSPEPCRSSKVIISTWT